MKRKSVGLGVVIWLGQPFALGIIGNQSVLFDPKQVFPTQPEGA